MSLTCWLSRSTVRLYPRSPARAYRRLTLATCRNETFSFQVAMRLEHDQPWPVSVSADAPDGWAVRVRRVGYVPVRHLNTGLPENPLDVEGREHIPGYVPDPLFDENQLLLPPDETHAFWITVRPHVDTAPGEHCINVSVCAQDSVLLRREVRVLVHDLVLQPRQDFTITHWFYADALCDWYGLTPFSAAFWPVCERYMQDYADHGLDMIYVPVFTPPLDGVKRPTQLLGVQREPSGDYRFDWSDVRRWVDLARGCGVSAFEWTHPFTQWGVKHAIRIYEGQGLDETLLWDPETPATSSVYREFLAQYLPELRRFLDEMNMAHCSAFHVSDEPHSEADRENYRAARELLRELAPWMTVMDALTDIEYGRRGLTDMPVPSIRTAVRFVEEEIPCWCYYCCGPRGEYLNRLLDTPLAKIAMHGFLFYRWPFKGFLHWGYNYWYRSQTRELIDPYHVQDGHKWPGWAYGDTCQVYPGPHGPVDSMRWEVFSESLQDYRLLQTLGVARDDPLVRGIRDFDDFPKTASWRRQTRKALFEGHGG